MTTHATTEEAKHTTRKDAPRAQRLNVNTAHVEARGEIEIVIMARGASDAVVEKTAQRKGAGDARDST